MPDSPQFELVSKLDAAKRQLRLAIRMFFEGRDTISIHTLATAAHQILFDLMKAHKPSALNSIVINPESPLIREEKRAFWAKRIRSAQNFFKHADRDPNIVHKFYHEVTRFYIFEATMIFRQLSTEPVIEVIVFQTWFFLKYPDLLTDEKLNAALSQKNITFDPNDFSLFLEVLNHPCARIGCT
ncbi:MAG: hypothetical protein AABZ11_02235 [Nitrospinota bacterium]